MVKQHQENSKDLVWKQNQKSQEIKKNLMSAVGFKIPVQASKTFKVR